MDLRGLILCVVATLVVAAFLAGVAIVDATPR